MTSDTTQHRYIRWFEEIGIEDVPVVDGKGKMA